MTTFLNSMEGSYVALTPINEKFELRHDIFAKTKSYP